jgi:hypothetical protein
LDNHFKEQRKPSISSQIQRRRDSDPKNILESKRDLQLKYSSNEKQRERERDLGEKAKPQVEESKEKAEPVALDDNLDVPVEVRELLHEHTDLDIDRFRSSFIYFPLFNLENVIAKLMNHYNA